MVSENFMRISRLVRHVFGFGAYSRTPSPDILSIAQWSEVGAALMGDTAGHKLRGPA